MQEENLTNNNSNLSGYSGQHPIPLSLPPGYAPSIIQQALPHHSSIGYQSVPLAQFTTSAAVAGHHQPYPQMMTVQSYPTCNLPYNQPPTQSHSDQYYNFVLNQTSHQQIPHLSAPLPDQTTQSYGTSLTGINSSIQYYNQAESVVYNKVDASNMAYQDPNLNGPPISEQVNTSNYQSVPINNNGFVQTSENYNSNGYSNLGERFSTNGPDVGYTGEESVRPKFNNRGRGFRGRGENRGRWDNKRRAEGRGRSKNQQGFSVFHHSREIQNDRSKILAEAASFMTQSDHAENNHDSNRSLKFENQSKNYGTDNSYNLKTNQDCKDKKGKNQEEEKSEKDFRNRMVKEDESNGEKSVGYNHSNDMKDSHHNKKNRRPPRFERARARGRGNNGRQNYDHRYNENEYYDQYQGQRQDNYYNNQKVDYYNNQKGDNYYNNQKSDNYYNNQKGDNYYNNQKGDNYYNNQKGDNYSNYKQDKNYQKSDSHQNQRFENTSKNNRGRGKKNTRRGFGDQNYGDESTASNTVGYDSPTNNNNERKKVERLKKEYNDTDDCRPQREKLTEQLTQGDYECMVCCDRIKQHHSIWSCRNCYNCFHFGCIKKWAGLSQEESGWRCPACQNPSPKAPSTYKCFCEKLREPEWNHRDIPHSCGEMCGKKRGADWCTHKCNVLCHPGPCPDCTAYVRRTCPCGAESKDVRCSLTEPVLCSSVCNKVLNCGVHKCERKCHVGSCDDCDVLMEQVCSCGKEKQTVLCIPDNVGITSFLCDAICDQALDCGNHKCQEKCHPGNCQSCDRTVSAITSCPCGKTPLEKLYDRDGATPRKTCVDSIPTCGQMCEQQLKCGMPGSYHNCQAMCHEGPCPTCPLESPVKCRCGFMDKSLLCSLLTTKADEVTCEKQCKKMRSCKRHKCGTKCCIDVEHVCSLICARTLTCGLHKCEEPCHRGNCPRCWQTSFDELSCHCGMAVIYPPVPCGTKPPVCDQPCRRPQPQRCNHPVKHHCHSDEETCAPCTMLEKKHCFKEHKMMASTPCYVSAISCGDLCNIALPCGIHQCQKVCHDGPCVSGTTLCPQKCTRARVSCGHACSMPCHPGKCPDTACKEMVKISCICGHRTCILPCAENDREYRAMATSLLASQMQQMNTGGSVDLSGIFTATARPDKLKRLECNEECQQVDRNRRLALALQIENPEHREKLSNTSAMFSDFLKEEVRKDPTFASMVHGILTELVIKAKDSKQKSRSHSFNPMNREKRQFIHEYCKNFGCQSQSYDEEPKKNVVATAMKGMCFLPPVSVITIIQRELGQKKVPGPVWTRKGLTSDQPQGGMKKLEKRSSVDKDQDPTTTTTASPAPATPSSSNAKPAIDYFDFED